MRDDRGKKRSIRARVAEWWRSIFAVAGSVSGATGWQYPPVNYEAMGNAYGANQWVFAAVNQISRTVASLPLKIYREKISADGQTEREEALDHPLTQLLWNPGPRLSRYELIQSWAANLTLYGESWTFVENGSTGTSLVGAPKQLQIIPPDAVSLKLDPLRGISKVRVMANGREIDLDPEFVVCAKTWNPADPFHGTPPTKAAMQSILIQFYLQRHNAKVFANSARPDVVLSTDRSLQDENRKAAIEAWKMAFGGEKAQGVAFMDNGLKAAPFAVTAKDGEFLGLDKMSREQILAVFGVPPVLVGVFEYANYANAKQQLQLFIRHTIAPICSLLQDSINTQLIPIWYRPDADTLYAEFDLQGQATIPEDEKIEAETAAIWVRSGIKTINDVRLDMNLPPLDWGDDKPAAAPTFGLGTLSADVPSRHRSVRARFLSSRADQWKVADRLAIIGEAKVRKAMAAFFKQQGTRVIAALTGDARAIRADAPFDLFDDMAENEALLKTLRPLFEMIVEDAGSAALGSVGSGIAFNAVDPRVLNYLAKKDLKVVGINDVTKEELRRLLVDATADSLTVSETGRKIRDMFDDMSTTRAETIARTEVVGANNAGGLEGFRQSGVVEKKEWLSVQDESVRDSHGPAPLGVDGQVVPLDALFSNGLDAPGGDGPPEETINCRCTILPVLEDGSDGIGLS